MLCDLSERLIYNASLVSSAYIDLWVRISKERISVKTRNSLIRRTFCGCIKLGPLAEEIAAKLQLRLQELLPIHGRSSKLDAFSFTCT